MKEIKGSSDIGRRLQLVIAERSMYSPDCEHYAELSEAATAILREYKNTNKKTKHIRHGFRLANGHYRMVVLNDSEAE